MKQIPRWALASAGTAPVALMGGWTLAQSRQPAVYSAIRDTISALAGYGAADRWVMTSGLAGLGACHVITAVGLRPAGRAARAVLAAGGMATILVAGFPQPADGNSVAHTAAAAVAFTALGSWPLFVGRTKVPVPLLSRPIGSTAAIVMLGLVAWFVAELHGGLRGLAERSAAGAQSLWPLAVVVTTRRALSERLP